MLCTKDNFLASKYGSRSRSPSDEGVRVHVADLGVDPSKRELESSFEKFGKLLEVWVAKSPPCFAFVVYKYREDAEAAIKEMDGKALGGSRIRVSLARPRTRGRRRRVFDPNLRCYQCGRKGHFFRDCDDSRRFARRRYMSRSPSRSYSRSRSRSHGRRSKNEKYRSRGSHSRSHSRSPKRSSKRKSSSRSPERSRKSRSKQRSSSSEKMKANDRKGSQEREPSKLTESLKSNHKKSPSVERSSKEKSQTPSPKKSERTNDED
ncbi:SFRS7 [Acanthosepion pharaonis]|uniref:SFRS7 n=1 Tax=Acanthosepion pharaonis TaxID=158019 RepID=A0A812DSE8_ACAPH|nr:SFRS7 [Sepia pharaonis]